VPPGSLLGNTGITCDASKNGGQESSPAANAAVCIVSYLDQFHLNPLLAALVNSQSWQSLAKILPTPALNALAISAPVDGHLQCVGFVAATAGFAYGQAFGQIDACSYIKNPPDGYKYVDGTSGIESGDFFIIDGVDHCKITMDTNGKPVILYPGHIGVDISPGGSDGATISCADANNIAPGEAQVKHGCFELSQITGYLRKQ
jgi:hypothetical protein